MKKQLLAIAALAFTGGIFLFTGCAKDDTSAPVITLKGSASQTISLNSTFTDEGATALDDKDGDLSTKIVATNTVNKDKKGTYTITYTVSDAAGNAATSVTRTVIVVNDADFLVGTYVNAVDSCQQSPASKFDASVTTSDTENNKFTINNFGALGATVNVLATLGANNTITIAAGQSLGTTSSIISASGTVISKTAPVKFKTSYSWTDGSSTEVCQSTYTK